MSEIHAIASPCIGVCIMDTDNSYCRGCYRTLGEIASWLMFTPSERAAVKTALERRRMDEENAN